MANQIPEHIADQAIAWFARLRADDVSLDDWRSFQAWLASEKWAAAAMHEVQDLWWRLSVLEEVQSEGQYDQGQLLARRFQGSRRDRL